MRKPVIAGNWKMHVRAQEATELVRQLRAACETDAVEVVVCPPSTSLATAHEALRGSSIGLGAQNVHWEPQGAFTGEISAPMLVEAGCRYVIIGHSERRQHFGETDATVRKRLGAALTHHLTPIVCIGETLAEREANQTWAVLERQLGAVFTDCAGWDCGGLILAYEPVWAIGTGRNATPEQAQDAHQFIRQWVAKRCGAAAAHVIRLLYGGSVSAGNAAGLLQQPDVDGALVGGASLKADAFTAIVRAAADTTAVKT